MRNIILFLSFLFYSPFVFSQSMFTTEIPVWDSSVISGLKDCGFYFNRIDLIENRIDTFVSKSKLRFTINDEMIVKEDNSKISFYEYDNLLVLNSDSNFEKEIMFLDFLYEEGSIYSISKSYSSENGGKVVINYDIENETKKNITSIYIYSNNKNDYCVVYTNKKKRT
jgi:hypothetical protein